ncbi:MAG TPA: D-xylose ABC transporter ATP-binding protein [Ruminiclostridium sp.]|nr:D-xylose ABC transporter ATP-binding protein [Ruminiclostridium sp.]
MDEELLLMRNITKNFPGVQALKNVNLTLRKGEVHALIGENGAGKSTLMKILSGVYQKDGGSIVWEGKELELHSPMQATNAGTSIIYQELNLMPNMSVAENIFIGRERKKHRFILNEKDTILEAERYIHEVGLNIDVRTKVEELSIAKRQMVEVAKALSVRAKLIVMDEPTSSLTDREIAILMDVIRRLRTQGVTVVFISHKLSEVFEISDRVTVLRDGECIDTLVTKDCDESQLIQMMVGRPLTDIFPKSEVPIGDTLLEVRNLCAGKLVKDVSFELKKGEILGFAGLVGAGRSEVMRAVFGVDRLTSGKIIIDGQTLRYHRPSESIKKGLGFMPEDRKLQGLILGMAVRENTTLASLGEISNACIINSKKEREVSLNYIEKLSIKTTGIEQKVNNLSGGNQQKVVIAKWLAIKPKVLILDEPTRGIDVGAKKEIYALMGKLAAEGVGIIMISSELPEVIGMSDRIVVMHEGCVRGTLDRKEASQEAIMNIILRENMRKV